MTKDGSSHTLKKIKHGKEKPREHDIIELRNIKKCYDDTVVVENFNLKVQKGEFVTFLGPSGLRKDHNAAHDRRIRIPDGR